MLLLGRCSYNALMDDQHDNGRRHTLPWVAAFFIALPVLYVLGLGPIMWASWNSWISPESSSWLLGGPYSPLVDYLNNHHDSWLVDMYAQYVIWWINL